MSLTSIVADNNLGSTVTFALRTPNNGYFVSGVEGLDPVNASIVKSDLAGIDGSAFQSARRESRNIVLNLGYEPNYTSGQSVSGLRRALYPILGPKRSLSLRLTSVEGGVSSVYKIDGYVETFESPLFASTSETSISIICMDPDFQSPVPTTSNHSTTAGTTNVTISYPGDVPTGFRVECGVNRSISGLTLHSTNSEGIISTLYLTHALVSGDKVIFQTVPGNKGVWLERSSVTTSILGSVSSASTWGVFTPGNNQIRLVVSGAAIPYTLIRTNRYGGL